MTRARGQSSTNLKSHKLHPNTSYITPIWAQISLMVQKLQVNEFHHWKEAITTPLTHLRCVARRELSTRRKINIKPAYQSHNTVSSVSLIRLHNILRIWSLEWHQDGRYWPVSMKNHVELPPMTRRARFLFDAHWQSFLEAPECSSLHFTTNYFINKL